MSENKTLICLFVVLFASFAMVVVSYINQEKKIVMITQILESQAVVNHKYNDQIERNKALSYDSGLLLLAISNLDLTTDKIVADSLFVTKWAWNSLQEIINKKVVDGIYRERKEYEKELWRRRAED